MIPSFAAPVFRPALQLAGGGPKPSLRPPYHPGRNYGNGAVWTNYAFFFEPFSSFSSLTAA